MKDGDLPFRPRVSERVLEPCQLRSIDCCRIEHEKLDHSVVAGELVIVASSHIEQRVLTLVLPAFINIVVAENGIEADALFNQRSEGLLEIPGEVATAAVRVNVIAGSDDEIQRCAL